MLDRKQRLTSSSDFVRAHRGRRAGTRSLVVSWAPSSTGSPGGPPGRVGFTVGRAVGGAVVRNRVRRRLRHLMRTRIARVPAGAVLAVRALPQAAATSYAGLGSDLDRALDRLLEAEEAR